MNRMILPIKDLFKIALSLCLILVFVDEPALARLRNRLPKDVSMTIYPVERGYDGAQFAISKQGYKVMLPGLGIAPDASEIAVYRDSDERYWYVDKKGKPTRITSDQINWVKGQLQQQMQMAGQAPYMQPPQSAPQEETSSGGPGSAVLTGLAAAGGAAAGVALTTAAYNNRTYHGIPYGAAVWRDDDHRAYYAGPHGNKVIVSNTHAPYCKEWERQRDWDDLSKNQQAALYNRRQINKSGSFNRSVNRSRSFARTGNFSRAGSFSRSGNFSRSVNRTRTRSRSVSRGRFR